MSASMSYNAYMAAELSPDITMWRYYYYIQSLLSYRML